MDVSTSAPVLVQSPTGQVDATLDGDHVVVTHMSPAGIALQMPNGLTELRLDAKKLFDMLESHFDTKSDNNAGNPFQKQG